MAKWKDGKKFINGPIVQSERKMGRFRISVHRHIYYPEDEWFVSCDPFFNVKKLASKKLGEARCQATALVQVELEKALNDIKGEE